MDMTPLAERAAEREAAITPDVEREQIATLGAPQTVEAAVELMRSTRHVGTRADAARAAGKLYRSLDDDARAALPPQLADILDTINRTDSELSLVELSNRAVELWDEQPAIEQQAVAADVPSDMWTITTRNGEEIARVEGATVEDMTRAAEALPAVRANINREGGFARRRLYTSELLPANVEQRVVEGVVVAHAGTAEGSAPADATHPDVVAAREALAGLAAAALTDHHDYSEPSDDERTVRGYVIDPRGQGRVALYPALDCLADRMMRRGWDVEKMLRSSQCVFAHRPTKDATPAEDRCKECAGKGCHWCHWTGEQQPEQAEADNKKDAAEAELLDTVDVVEEAEAADGTWRGGWIVGTTMPADEVLFNLDPADTEQGALFI
ncbi:hypothetical protein [Streptomyces noursei]|uniref:hypothetical protein n=1 Tax=Streptomyces noursei TaxID=1971 RepID=UPI001962E7A0|nr:hypothetical protein [Streptomyces noursei]QRX90839.1 hypothetical protein JNO44_08365 [Streptomyces noursei]